MKKIISEKFKTLLIFFFSSVLIFNSVIIPNLSYVSAYVIENFNESDIYFVNMAECDSKDGIETDSEKKYIALTFDDGPHPEYTHKILDILEEKNITATFFVVGFRAELHPKTILRMKAMNCEIANHTYTHEDLKKISCEDALYQIEMCNEKIFEITGEYPKVYRPPFGKISSEAEKMIDMKKVLWTVDSWDWKYKDDRIKVINNVMKQTKANSIILMHDFYKTTLSVLPEIIDRLKAKGYEFKTVSELLKIELA